MYGGIRELLFFFKQKTAYEMRISDWSSDVCSSDLNGGLNSTPQSGGGRRTSPHVGDRGADSVVLERHELVRSGIVEYRAHELVIERMTGLVGGIRADHGVAQQIQIADSIENLVADQPVVVAQAVVDDAAKIVERQ